MLVCRTSSADTFQRLIGNWVVQAGLAVLALFVVVSPALATTIIPYDGAQPQTFTVSTTETYTIFAWGAAGGSRNLFPQNGQGGTGGGGAEIAGQFTLTAGEVLTIFVGGAGNNGIFDGAGGGGTFVIGPTGDPLVVAGGGGGAGITSNGQGGLTGASNSDGGSASDVSGGGGGFSTSGGSAGRLLATGGGGSGNGAGGGGGGYSGGNAGYSDSAFSDAGGGGGSFDSGMNQVRIAGFQSGNGVVEIYSGAITFTPEPTSLAMIGSVFAALAASWLYLNRLKNGSDAAGVQRTHI